MTTRHDSNGASDVITPPAMLGVLGGGQLGRYFVLAARTMGYRTTVLEPDPGSPAVRWPTSCRRLRRPCCTRAGSNCAGGHHRVRERIRRGAGPAGRSFRCAVGALTTQDRIAEKQFLDDIGVGVAPYVVIVTDADLADAAGFSFPAILKTARLGYDGKGQIRCAYATDLAAAWDELGRVPCVLEQRLPLDRELSLVLARTADGRVACYPVSQNQHVHGILDVSYTPANLPGTAPADAAELCTYIAEELQFVGVMAVEMFVVGRDVLVNELAPRPHNSGHYTLDACLTSQFEQQVRAICGLALGDTKLVVPGVAMVNLLGQLWADGEPRWQNVLGNSAAHLHLYGKSEPRAGRKMGHLTVTTGTAMGATSLARRLRKQLGAS
jgi:5-(carboxyamino)imidazole ribonucleotide synthase